MAPLRRILLLTLLLMICLNTSSKGCSQTLAKWGRHKKNKEPLVIPEAPFSVDAMDDPREAAVHMYLDKKLDSLKTDLVTYPGLKVQIQALIDEINALELIPVSDPDYASKFDAMHTSLLWLWDMEAQDAI